MRAVDNYHVCRYPGDLAGVLALAVKVSVLVFSAGVVYSPAQSKKRVEAGLAFKRGQVELLEKKVTETESEIVKTASAGEVGTLVSGVLHDLGNAVSVIMLSAELVSADENPDKKDVERILKGARYAKGLLSAALSIVRGQEYTFEPARLKETAESVALLVDFTAKRKNVSLELAFPEDLPEMLISRAHIERVFINTLSNSLSFVPQGGRIGVSARAGEKTAIVEISDNGPGFPEKLLKSGIKAFGTTRKDKGGTGLGLFVCEQIALRHGGSMRLETGPGRGQNHHSPGRRPAVENASNKPSVSPEPPDYCGAEQHPVDDEGGERAFPEPGHQKADAGQAGYERSCQPGGKGRVQLVRRDLMGL